MPDYPETIVRPAELPARLGRYLPIERLGAGAMGVVWRAHDPAIDRSVAIKVMRTGMLDDAARDAFLERFRTEVRAAGRCSHPAIVAVYDFADDPEAPYIVMEFVEGTTLGRLLRESAANRAAITPRLVAAMLEVLDGLGAAHATGVVHRDVKPGNIMITPSGAAKLADFGIARVDLSALTGTGAMIGTPGYMAPEQALGRAVDHRVDLFAAAAIVFEILVGRAPFAGTSLPETLLRLTSPDPVELGPLARTALAPVLARGLAKTPEHRFDSAAQFRDALRAALTGGFRAEAETIVRPMTEPGGCLGSHVGSLGTGAVDRFEPALLARLREDLVQQIGPIADTLLRRAAAGAATPQDLLGACVGMIEDPHERAEFLRRNRALLATGTGSRAGSRVPTLAATGFAPDSAAIAAVEAALAFHLGPIARVLVRKEAGAAGSAQDLVERLAAHVEPDADAVRFRRSALAALDGR
ncbi:serine/threonine-protein kinase [Elioraea sp.]|uniref:serine/threonine-protein kinase n=1 Tax=Elioraea sp. TaxID=2185103 RepID=UPI003F6EE407